MPVDSPARQSSAYVFETCRSCADWPFSLWPTLPAGSAIPGFPQHAVAVRYATEHRCGVVVRGAGLCDAISGTDPLRDNLPLQASVKRPVLRRLTVKCYGGSQLKIVILVSVNALPSNGPDLLRESLPQLPQPVCSDSDVDAAPDPGMNPDPTTSAKHVQREIVVRLLGAR